MRDSANVFGSFLSSVQGVGEKSAKRVIESATGAFSNLGGLQNALVSTVQGGRSDTISNVLRTIARSEEPATIASLMKSMTLGVDALIPVLRDAQEAGLLTVQVFGESRSYMLTPDGKAVVSASEIIAP